ncbi:MAG TPA: ATP-binding protein [Acidisarcina sp.]|nr:ATP-binding protein [Acidisarcina sp.]
MTSLPSESVAPEVASGTSAFAGNHPPTPLPDIAAALKRVAPLHDLSQGELEWLAAHGTERFAPAGSTLFHEGDPATKMMIILKGEVHVRRERGPSTAIFVGRAGQITALLPFSRMKSYGGLGFTTSDTWALEFDRSLFPEILQTIPSFGQRIVSVLLDRVREVTRIEQQTEKLTALGKLAGNLAHELNNPASAAQRAASGLLEELRVYGHEKFRMGRLCLNEQQSAKIEAWERAVHASGKANAALDEAHQPQREDDIIGWLESRRVPETWLIAPDLAELGTTTAQLDELAEFLNLEQVAVVLTQFASVLRAEKIADAMLHSTDRIFELIGAIKDYSYMDQAPIQEIDIPKGIEATLSMLQSRLTNVEIERNYQPDLPMISAYASELNQVWTALIENSLDAMRDKGHLKLSCRQAGENILIEVWDDGPGIPPDLQDRIFEPFFTTKPPGKGLGLGLDTVTRIIHKHRGYVTVKSKPGATCFQIQLPIAQLQAY